ncbi:hypothetical protein [Natrinema salaciae]|uniref:Uncharacterized protein n=1 Tax=Natrinema salaciae TaxID=1186196 RepID=A0A1H9K264_9EURY|nr:hypothetical protein [Natrinema salaciae]SEQ93222.1 hypothetical protein SAMN04489841_2775 [Natrinema salaciae]
MRNERSGANGYSPTDSGIAGRPRGRDVAADDRPSRRPPSRDAITDGGHDPGSIERRLAEIDKQAGIVLKDLETADGRDLEPAARCALEDYLGTIRFYTEAATWLLEHGPPPADDGLSRTADGE